VRSAKSSFGAETTTRDVRFNGESARSWGSGCATANSLEVIPRLSAKGG